MTGELADIARTVWDVLVVGAGPAGALASRQVANQGASVLLVDKAAFPRWKVCGCCLNGLALDILDAAGLSDLPSRFGARPLRRFCLATPYGTASIPLAAGVSLSREAFDSALVEEARRANVRFLPRTIATIHEVTDEGLRTVSLSQQGQEAVAHARVVLAADGLAGHALKELPEFVPMVDPDSRLGTAAVLDASTSFYESGTIYMATARGGYVGLVRLEDDRIDVAASLDRAEFRIEGGPAIAVSRILADVGLPLPQGLHEANWRGTPMLTRHRSPLSAQGLFVLGDAAGYVEPFTGEGMAWAMLSATLVVPWACRAMDGWTIELDGAWDRCYGRFVRPRQRVVRAASYVLKRPRVTGLLARFLGRMPSLARPVLRTLNAPAKYVPRMQ